MAKKISKLRPRMSPESKDRAEVKTKGMLEEMALAELRRSRELSQSELARILGIRQPSIADMEKRTDMYISRCATSLRAWEVNWTSSHASLAKRYG